MKADNNITCKLLYNLIGILKSTRSIHISERNWTILEMRLKYYHSFEIIGNQLNISNQRTQQLYNKTIEYLGEISEDLFATIQISPSINAENINTELKSITLISEIIGIDKKVEQILRKNNIYTVNDILTKSREDLASLNRLNKKTVDKIFQLIDTMKNS